MTRATFLARLAATPRTWKLDEDCQIRCARGDCPIVAVDGHGFSNFYWDGAAAALGLPPKSAKAIVLAADNDEQADPFLRQQLLVATGLAEKESGT